METKPPAARGLKNACGLFSKDLQALPEEVFTKGFGGKARTVADIVFEVNLVNDHVGMVMRGEEPFEWPDCGWIKAPAEFGTKAEVVAAFEKSSERIVATAESYSAEELEAPLETDEGVTTRAERCRFMTLHLWYHSGQLNFIQTMLGDDAFHWQS